MSKIEVVSSVLTPEIIADALARLADGTWYSLRFGDIRKLNRYLLEVTAYVNGSGIKFMRTFPQYFVPRYSNGKLQVFNISGSVGNINTATDLVYEDIVNFLNQDYDSLGRKLRLSPDESRIEFYGYLDHD